MNSITIFKPLLEIKTYSWNKFYYPQEDEIKLLKAINDNKFIKIWSSTIATSSIEIVTPAEYKVSILEQSILNLSESEKKEVRIIANKIEKQLTQWVINNIIEKVKNKFDNN